MIEELPKEEEVRAKRDELDEKYPLENIDETIVPEEEVVEPAPMQDPGDGPTVVMDEDVIVRSEPRRERSEKFDQLKFGDNYDV